MVHMRFEVGTFPGNPSSTPGSCRGCGIGYLRDGETGVIVTDWWIDMEGVIVLCQSCAAEMGRLAPDSRVAALEAELAAAKADFVAVELELGLAFGIIQSQRAEMALPAPAKAAKK